MSDRKTYKTKEKKKNWQSLYAQIIFVVIAFTLMVIVSYIFLRSNEQAHLERETDDHFTSVESMLYADLKEFETMLSVVSRTIQGMMLNGYDMDVVERYMVDITRHSSEDARIPGFLTFFAFFGEEALDGFNALDPNLDWDALYAEGFVIQERPWYIAAQTSGTEIVTTDPYVDIITKEVTFTYACNIYDNDGKRMAIVCLDVLLNRLYEFSVENRNNENGIWMLADRNHVLIAHQNADFIGQSFHDIDSPLIHLVDRLKHDGTLANVYVNDYWGRPVFVTIRPINNGWNLGIVTYADSYYAGLYNILIFLIALGTVLAGSLILILVRINKEKEKADERAHESEERTRIMLESTPLGAHFWDLKENKVIDCNIEAVKLFGLSDKREYLDRYLEFSPQHQPDGMLSADKRAEVMKIAAKKGKHELEWMFRTLDGEDLPCMVTIVSVNHSGSNLITYYRDLRKEKRMLEDMHKAIEEKTALTHMNNILNGIDAMICVTDPETDEFLFINDSMRQVFHIDDDYEGLVCYKLLHGLDSRCSYCPCHYMDSEPGHEVVFEQKNELLGRVFRSYSKYIKWPNGKNVHIQHSIDVTDIKKAENEIAEKNKQLEEALYNEEQANKAKSAFLANMSHEIRTPMNAILGITELQLRSEALTPEIEEGLEQVYDSGNLLLNIINDILDLSKIEAGKMEIIPARYEIPSLINDTVQLNRIRYDSKPLDFTLDVDPKTPLYLIGDELRIKQVLNNILSNAFKYTDKGGVKFSISVLPEQDLPEGSEKMGNDAVLVFTVSDTGHGMTPEQLERLFDEYSRFNLEANHETLGTGLGMSITKRLLDLMGGEITVESRLGKGSTFTVTLPQKRVNMFVCGNETVEKLRKFHYHGSSMSKKSRMLREYMPYGNVLVVDDVESNIYVTRGMLMPYGLHVDTTTSGQGAIEKIKDGNEYDIIFMDHMMPKMDGIEAVKILRGMGYAKTIIALTANALVGQAEIFFKNGFDGYISKPIDSRELNHILNEHIRNKKAPSVVNEARRVQREKETKFMQHADSKSTQQEAAPATEPAKSSEASKVVEYFLMDAEAFIVTLTDIMEAEGDMSDEDLDTYEITVHGLKSAFNNIGEAELSAAALELEKAAKAKDIAKIRAETPALISSLKAVVEKLEGK